jgi:hypothetical protein
LKKREEHKPFSFYFLVLKKITAPSLNTALILLDLRLFLIQAIIFFYGLFFLESWKKERKVKPQNLQAINFESSIFMLRFFIFDSSFSACYRNGK